MTHRICVGVHCWIKASPGDVVSNASAHNFGLVVLYVTVAEQKRQLSEAGFVPEMIFDSARGLPVTESDDLQDVWWPHYAARKPA